MVMLKWKDKEFKIISIGRKEFHDEDLRGWRNRYKILVELVVKNQRNPFTGFDFHDSIDNYSNGKQRLTDNDLIWAFDCFLTDGEAYLSNQDIDEFANMFGYTKVSEALKAYNGCKRSYEKISKTLGISDDELYDLINYLHETYDI